MFMFYTLEQAKQWDSVVRSFKEYDIYWLSGYVKAFQVHGDGIPLLFYYDKDGTRGINVVMKRDIAQDKRFIQKIPEGQYFDFASPYGYGGWIIEGSNRKELFSEYDAWIKKEEIISEFVRFHPILMNQESCQCYYDVIQLGEVVHMDLKSPEIIWNNIKSKNRNMIRKAIKNNIKIYYGRFPKIYNSFYSIYNATMDKDNAEKYYYFSNKFYQSILEDLPQNAQIFYAEKDDTIISAAIILAANGHMNYHLSGSLQEYNFLAPTNLLLYEAALWGFANGYKTFYLGGGVGSEEDSLFKFKKSFYKGKLNHFFIGKKIHNQEKYEKLVRMRTSIKGEYFPLYRA